MATTHVTLHYKYVPAGQLSFDIEHDGPFQIVDVEFSRGGPEGGSMQVRYLTFDDAEPRDVYAENL